MDVRADLLPYRNQNMTLMDSMPKAIVRAAVQKNFMSLLSDIGIKSFYRSNATWLALSDELFEKGLRRVHHSEVQNQFP